MMKLEYLVLLVVLTSMFPVLIVQADPWSAIDSGYAVTTNYHGQDVIPPPDPPLRAKVGVLAVNFNELLYVKVELRDPNGNVVLTVNIDKSATWIDDISPKGNPIKYAWTDPLIPDTWAIGHYSVKAYFYAEGGRGLANEEDLYAMRATSIMTIPEIPLGTLTVIATMLISLALFSRARNMLF